MPEMPEVDQFVRYFNQVALHKKIRDVHVKTASLIYKKTVAGFKQVLVGEQFKHANRQGKFMIVSLEHAKQLLVIHFGMTGLLVYKKKDDLSAHDTAYAQVQFIFEDGSVVLWINKRKLGKVYLVASVDDVETLKDMGPDPLSLSKTAFLSLLQEHEQKNIKAFLMDQSDIAGIGNNYSNEILFQAGIDPHHSIENLSEQRRVTLFTVMQRVLKKAMSIDTIDGDFPSSWLLAHKKGMKCPKGDGALVKKTIAGRSAIYCPKHQT